MRTLRNGTALLAFVTIVACLGQLAAQEQANQPFSITISAVKSAIKVGSRLELKVRLTNIYNHEINGTVSYAGGTIVSYQCDLRDSTGAQVPMKETANSSGPPIPAQLSVQIRTLKPNESVEDTTRACKEFDMSKPGVYTVQLSRRISGGKSEDVVKSNTITITVVAPSPEADTPK